MRNPNSLIYYYYRLQARGSDLVCQANDALVAQSKSGDAKLSFYESIHLEASEIVLDANNVFIPKGLKYLDSTNNSPYKSESGEQVKNDANDNENFKQEQAQRTQSNYEALELISIGDQLATAE